ncbi:MAG: peptidase C14, caspase catalytic subunit p20, partial [Planctomycetota bacterium]
GNARHELKEFDAAIADHTRAIELGVAIGYKNRAAVKRTMGDLDGAVADIETFLEIPPIRPPDDPVRLVLRALKGELAKSKGQ